MSDRPRHAPWFRSGKLRWGHYGITITVGHYMGVQVWIGEHYHRFEVEEWDRAVKAKAYGRVLALGERRRRKEQ